MLIITVIALMVCSMSYGSESIQGTKTQSLNKTTAVEDLWLNVNRLNGVMRNNGVWFYNYATSDWGLEWPRGSGLSPVYAGGQWISAKVNDEVRVAAVIHSASEYQPGEILEGGVAANTRDSKYQWYLIQSGGVGDWDTWPMDQGAPVDQNGKPLLIGDWTAFCVWNDLGEHSLFGTNKLGAEVRQQVFAFNRADAMGDMAFIKWQIINKSVSDWDSTYLSIWFDPDLGNEWDDFVGCDPELGLGFCYNSENEDQEYGAAPPAVGIDYFQGPIIDESGSTVLLPNGTVLEDKRMLNMTSFTYYNNDASNQGNPQTSGDVWNYQRGFWRDNSLITDPAGSASTFMYSGDPETGSGWLDTDASDRRFLMTTGPFTMPKWQDSNGNSRADFGEPGVQEIVAGIIVARGPDNLQSVTLLKSIDELAQMAYDLNFKLSRAPYAPLVDVRELPREVLLSWSSASEFNADGTPYASEDPIVVEALGDTVIMDNAITVISDASYNFYGYTVYQYADASGRNPVVVAHWDNGGTHDAEPYSFPRFVRITQNRHNANGVVGDPLINGKEYYFGVVAHGYLAFGAPKIFNSPSTIVRVVPRYTPGERYRSALNDTISTVRHLTTIEHAARADADVIVRIIDPSEVSGHDYDVLFYPQPYFRDENGQWHKVNGSAKRTALQKGTDVSPSTLTGNAVYSETVGSIDLNYVLDLISPTEAWVDGVQLTFPPEITINRADPVHSFNDVIDPVIDHAANTVMWGRSDTTEGGDHSFIGGESFPVNVNTFTLPLIVDYLIYDDGFGSEGQPINAVGKDTIQTIGYEYRTENHWKLVDKTLGRIVLLDQKEVFNMSDDGLAGPIVDGMQVIVKGDYSPPWDFYPPADPPLDGSGSYDIDSYGANNWSEFGPTSSARAIHSFGAGTSDLNMLVQDYELRFTGEYVDPTADVVYVKEGTGSVATLYGARLFDIADHPMNPNPGSSAPFAIRIPFEVWNVDQNKQVNLMVYDRMQDPATTTQWYAFNPANRMYCFILNTDYAEVVHDPEAAEMEDLTWSLVFWETDWMNGDVIHVNYQNPIQPGIDQFSFSTAGLEKTTFVESEKSDIDKIQVVPNPYYGYHSGEMNPFDRWVQFTYLPERCTIRIFDLTGTMVRKLEKNDPTTPFLQWNLENEYELPVASGIYVYHVDIPDMGEKIGKIAVFTPNERLDTY